MNNKKAQKLTPEYLLKQIYGVRHSLLIVLIFTLVNLVMLLLDGSTYFLFSASVPYYLTAFAMGMDMGMGYEGIGTFTLIALVLVFYLLCWLQCKKRPGWYVAALVAFILDTLALVGLSLMLEMVTDNIMDFVFHGWVIISLIQGISANRKLRKLVEEFDPDADELLSRRGASGIIFPGV